MNAREKMLRVLSGERLYPPPVVLHGWGDYKVELAGLNPRYQYYLGGPELTRVEAGFYQRFRPDWIHVGAGARHEWWNRSRKTFGERAYLQSRDGSRWLEIRDNYYLTEDDTAPASSCQPRLLLESKASIDEFYDSIETSETEVLASGCFDHVADLSRAFGKEVIIAVNEGAPGCGLHGYSFEESLVACLEKPDLVAHAIYRDCESFLARVRAAKLAGADAFIFSEGFGGSLDMLSPECHLRLEAETKRWFYSEVSQIGLLGIGYWLGDVRPNMELINSLDMAALMIEEDKKTFELDPTIIRRQLRPQICLFGNLDSALLLRGSPEEVREAARRQKEAAKHGPFVAANGSPLVLGSPAGNLEAMIDEARR